MSPASAEAGFWAKAGLKISNTCWHFEQRIFFDGLRSKRSSSY
jgi:hypothetical protein